MHYFQCIPATEKKKDVSIPFFFVMEKKISSGLIVGHIQQMLVVDIYIYIFQTIVPLKVLWRKKWTRAHVMDSTSQCAYFNLL